MRALLLVALLLAPAAARSATLRPFGILSGAQVAVSDIWDDAGPSASRILGPSPAPGERIVVEAAQLAAIARDFDVDWRPDSPTLRTVLERPGVPLPSDLVAAALRPALTRAGAPDGDLETPDFVPPLVAPEAAVRIVVEQCSWAPATAAFVARLAVTGRDMATLRLAVSGRVVAMTDAMAATRRLNVGAKLQAGDLALVRVARERLRADPLPTDAAVVGMVLRRSLAQGEPALASDLAPPIAVAKGARVTIAIRAAGLAVNAVGEAMQSGVIGERIEVRNPGSRALLLAEVTGPGAVRVEPGSAPLGPPRAGAGDGAP